MHNQNVSLPTWAQDQHRNQSNYYGSGQQNQSQGSGYSGGSYGYGQGGGFGPSHTNYNTQGQGGSMSGGQQGYSSSGNLPYWAQANQSNYSPQGHGQGGGFGPSYTNYNTQGQGVGMSGGQQGYSSGGNLPYWAQANQSNYSPQGHGQGGGFGPSYTNYNTHGQGGNMGGGQQSYSSGGNLPYWAQAGHGQSNYNTSTGGYGGNQYNQGPSYLDYNNYTPGPGPR